jgi:hypothetical protein
MEASYMTRGGLAGRGPGPQRGQIRAARAAAAPFRIGKAFLPKRRVAQALELTGPGGAARKRRKASRPACASSRASRPPGSAVPGPAGAQKVQRVAPPGSVVITA